MDIEWILVGLTSLVIFVATVVHGIAGFGYAQVAMGLLPLFRSPGPASVVFTITAVFANWRVFWSVRDEFAWKDWAVPVAGLIVGLPVGIYVFTGLNDALMRLAIGIVLLVSVAFIIAIRQSSFVNNWIQQNNIKPGWKTAVTAGFFGGILGGAVAIPGPPMILYGAFMMGAGFWSDTKMKAVLTAFFGTLMLYRLGTLIVTADVTLPLTIEALIALPALFLGAWAGIQVFNRLPQHIFRWLVLIGLTITAALLIIAAF
ncbi:MAG: sulfite exporter TauE/SafE family protein [Thermoplasmatota archaeon]